MQWIMLAIAICLEVFATSMLKLSEGFTRLWPTVAVIVGYAVSFYLLAQVVKVTPVSITYAIWAAAGTLLVVGVGVIAYHERLTMLQILGVVLTIAGVLLLNLGGASHHGDVETSADASPRFPQPVTRTKTISFISSS
ncbi:DMT family transporter [Microbacterium sp. NPDC058342]|uniref:DMT family transporter n=1 Tax=Microbacterium sp. NPDC058342 TaxID=3346454 RepID=UPI00364C71B6